MEEAGGKEGLMETYISFYLSSSRIHVFRKAIADIGNPKYIRFLVKDEGPSLLMEAYEKRDFHSHRVRGMSGDRTGMEINSFPLCTLLKNRLGWEDGKSYRVPGKTYSAQHVAVFDLTAAELTGDSGPHSGKTGEEKKNEETCEYTENMEN